jgi:hypothetical protein
MPHPIEQTAYKAMLCHNDKLNVKKSDINNDIPAPIIAPIIPKTILSTVISI